MTGHTYTIPYTPKALRETLSIAQAALSAQHNDTHAARLGAVIRECDRKRPLGPDGTHGDRHTPECGCPEPAPATLPGRRTIRRYAHELHPHPAEGEVRPLTVEVPYLYARAVGLMVWGTGWIKAPVRESVDRTIALIDARRIALTADALAQGMTGDAAWRWVAERADDESGECVYDRAVAWGVDVDQIKPYPCGPTPLDHDHYAPPDARGARLVTVVPGAEDACQDCTEPIPAAADDETPKVAHQ